MSIHDGQHNYNTKYYRSQIIALPEICQRRYTNRYKERVCLMADNAK